MKRINNGAAAFRAIVFVVAVACTHILATTPPSAAAAFTNSRGDEYEWARDSGRDKNDVGRSPSAPWRRAEVEGDEGDVENRDGGDNGSFLTCLLLKRDVQHDPPPVGGGAGEAGADDQSWECELDPADSPDGMPGHILSIRGLFPDFVERHSADMTSGESTLTVPKGAVGPRDIVLPQEGASPTVKTDASWQGGKKVGGEEGGGLRYGDGGGGGGVDVSSHDEHRGRERHRIGGGGHGRHLAEMGGTGTGTRTRRVLAIRVNAQDASTTATKSDLADKIFGTKGDIVNLRSRFEECSFGKLRMEPFLGETTGGPTITNGVYEVSLTTNVKGVHNEDVRGAVTTAATAALGDLPKQFDHVMLCLPPGTGGGFIAYAYINHWLSVYNDVWCTRPSAQVHEIGHNLALSHAGEGSATYGDQSGMMGYSYGDDEGPVMCFNAAKSWQLDWYMDRHATASPISRPWRGRLVGVADYGDSEDRTVLLRIKAGPTNYYVNFNRKVGINAGTVEGGDLVMITSQKPGYSRSSLVAKLGYGDQYELEDFNQSGKNAIVRVINIQKRHVPWSADVLVYLKGFELTLTDYPTMAPTRSPVTSNPTGPITSDPTKAPTLSPTFAPTLSLSATPSAAPTISAVPSTDPSSRWSAEPSSLPTENPTVSSAPSALSWPSAVPTDTTPPSSPPTSSSPSGRPSSAPTSRPSPEPTTAAPSTMPTGSPPTGGDGPQNKLATTFNADNGQAGNMFDVVALNSGGVVVSGFDIHTELTGVVQAEVYALHVNGTWVGHEDDASAWTMVMSRRTVTGAGMGMPTPLPPLDQAVHVAAGETQAFYVTLTTGDIKYTNGDGSRDVGSVFVTNEDVAFLVGCGKRYEFDRTYEPRIWNGVMRYTVESGGARLLQSPGLPQQPEANLGEEKGGARQRKQRKMLRI